MYDKELIRARFGARFDTYDAAAVVQARMCDELAAACRPHVVTAPAAVLEVGAGTGLLTRRMVEMWPEARFVLNDISERAARFAGRYVAGAEYLWGDAEAVAFPDGMDVVASASTVQWFDRLPDFVAKAAAATRTGGLLALATFGPENYTELRALTGRGLAYHTPDALAEMVRAAGYGVLHRSQYTVVLPFESPAHVLRHIKATGVNSLASVQWTPQRMARFGHDYRERFSTPDGRVGLTYHPVIVVARLNG